MVLGRPGGERGLVVGSHTERRGLVKGSLGFQFGLDLGAALGELTELLTTETNDLTGVVTVRAPRHREPKRQRPLEVDLVNRARSPAQVEQRAGVQSHVAAVGLAPHEVRDQAVFS